MQRLTPAALWSSFCFGLERIVIFIRFTLLPSLLVALCASIFFQPAE